MVVMDHLPAVAAGTWAFAKAVSLLSDGATSHLRKGDISNDVIRRKVIGELLEVRDSLSTLTLKELETARFQLENGLILCQHEEATSYAHSEFEAARRNAEMAFSAVHDVEAKIEATKMAVMAALYQYDDELNIAHTLCMQYIRRLHELPELKETLRVHMYESTPMSLSEATEWLIHLYWMPKGSAWPIVRDITRVYRALKDWVTQTDRKAVLESVCRLNLILAVFFLKNKVLDDLQDWPSISIANHDPIQPLEHILGFDKTNQHQIRGPDWDVKVLGAEDNDNVICLCHRPKSPLEVVQLNINDMSESRLLKIKYWPCVLHAINDKWVVIVGQREGTCGISVLNRRSWRFDREKEIAYQQNNNDQLVRVLQVSLQDDLLCLLQRNGSVTQIDLNKMAIQQTTSLHLAKEGAHPYAKGLEFDEPLDEYELDFLQRTDGVKLTQERTTMDGSQVVLARQRLTSYDIQTGAELTVSRSERLEAGLDVLTASTDGYVCLLYVRTDHDDLLPDRPGSDLQIRTSESLDTVTTRKMPYFRQSRHLEAAREGDFLAVICSRTLSLWELNSATLLAEYTFTTLEPTGLHWFNGRFLLVNFSGGVVCKYEIMS